jgi:diacylglycerol diphosphate phosphatase/phosphatidate phosphatase
MPKLSSDIESGPPSTTSRRNRLIPGFHTRPPFLRFLRTNGYDIATQLVCVGIAWALYTYCPPIMPRYFPYYPGIEKSSWGMAHSRPYIKEYVNTIVSAVVSFVVPAAVMGGIALWGTRRFEDGDAAVSFIHLHPEHGRTWLIRGVPCS